MSHNLTQTLIHSHLADGILAVDEEIAVRIDQVLLQDFCVLPDARGRSTHRRHDQPDYEVVLYARHSSRLP